MAISTPGMLLLTDEFKKLKEDLHACAHATSYTLQADGHKMLLKYYPVFGILIVSVPALGVCIAAHAQMPGTALALVERRLWKCEKRPGYVCVIDESQLRDTWVRAGEFEKRLKIDE